MVLVVDIGGGTTDCSVLRMGPSHRDRLDRDGDLLGHSGQRIGGNDFDIRLTVEGMMPLLGMHETLKTGKPLPHRCSGMPPPSTTSAPRAASTAWRPPASCRICSSTASPAASWAASPVCAPQAEPPAVWRAEQGKIALSTQESITNR